MDFTSKEQNEKILLIVDTINTAINERKKITFKYFTYNVRKEKKEKHAGEVYKLSPYRLVWNGDYYYAVGYSEKHGAIGSYRVDRISMVPEILEEKAVPAPRDFNIDTYLNSMFRMYNGEIKQVELVCDNSIMDAIIDRFGEDIKIYANDLNTFRIIVNTTISHIFFSWVFGFCGKVKIKSPVEIKEQYVNMVEEAMKSV